MGATSTLVPGSRLAKTLISEYHDHPLFNELLWHPKEPFEVRNGFLLRGSRLCIPHGTIKIKLLHSYYSTLCTGHLEETRPRIDYFLCTIGRICEALLKIIWKVVIHANKPRHGTTSHTVYSNQSNLHNPSGMLLPCILFSHCLKQKTVTLEFQLWFIIYRRWSGSYQLSRTLLHQKLLWSSMNMFTATIGHQQRSVH